MAILDERTVDFISTSVEQTLRLGVRLGELLEVNDCLCLSGEMGAGKTVFARGVGRGWGSTVRVTSPTFTLINEYPRLPDGRILYHVDGYRLESEGDVVTSGLEDVVDRGGVMMIEWPERVGSVLPADHLWLTLTYINEMRRSLRFVAHGERSMTLLREFRQRAFGV